MVGFYALADHVKNHRCRTAIILTEKLKSCGYKKNMKFGYFL